MQHPFDSAIYDIVGITISSPAAGASIVFSPNIRTRYAILGIEFNFQTSAVVASRVVNLNISDGGTIQTVDSGSAQAASLNVEYHWCLGLGDDILFTGSRFTLMLPQMLWLRASATVVITAASIDAADQFSISDWYIAQQISA